MCAKTAIAPIERIKYLFVVNKKTNKKIPKFKKKDTIKRIQIQSGFLRGQIYYKKARRKEFMERKQCKFDINITFFCYCNKLFRKYIFINQKNFSTFDFLRIVLKN